MILLNSHHPPWLNSLNPQMERHTEVSVPVFGPSTSTDFHASFMRGSTPSNHEWNTLALNGFFFLSLALLSSVVWCWTNQFPAPPSQPGRGGYVACFPVGYSFYGSLNFFSGVRNLVFIRDLSRFRNIDSAIRKAQATRNTLSKLVCKSASYWIDGKVVLRKTVFFYHGSYFSFLQGASHIFSAVFGRLLREDMRNEAGEGGDHSEQIWSARAEYVQRREHQCTKFGTVREFAR